MHSFPRRIFLSCAGLVLAAGVAGLAAIIAVAVVTTKSPLAVVVQGVPLQLNGTGTRYKAIFKVYHMAMYAAAKVGTVDEALMLTTPVRLNFVALRELSGTDLGRLFARGMGDNSPREALSRHAVSSRLRSQGCAAGH